MIMIVILVISMILLLAAVIIRISGIGLNVSYGIILIDNDPLSLSKYSQNNFIK